MLSFESPVKTFWHGIAVGWKFLAVCFFSVFLFVFDSIYIQLVALCVCALAYGIGGARFSIAGFEKLKFLWPFLVIIVVWHGLTGTLAQGVSITLRLLTIVGLSNLMTMTSRLSDLLHLIQVGLKPIRALGIRTRPLEIAIALVVRFTPVLIAKGSALLDAWRMRAKASPNWRIAFPLSLVAIDDAEHVAEALKARGGIGHLSHHDSLAGHSQKVSK